MSMSTLRFLHWRKKPTFIPGNFIYSSARSAIHISNFPIMPLEVEKERWVSFIVFGVILALPASDLAPTDQIYIGHCKIWHYGTSTY